MATFFVQQGVSSRPTATQPQPAMNHENVSLPIRMFSTLRVLPLNKWRMLTSVGLEIRRMREIFIHLEK
jgi:hypothetical protein